MDRRTFVKSSAMLGMAGLTSAIPLSGEAAVHAKSANKPFPSFKFKNGKFKILQFTDTHYIAGDSRSERALKNVRQMLDMEKPDLVIHTGDIIFGKPAEQSLKEILTPISERHIPFAVTLGNHDQQFGMTRQEVFDYVKTLPGNINQGVPGLTGASNDIITLQSANGSNKWILYLFDSLENIQVEGLKGYDFIHHDQIEWYTQQSKTFTQQNGGKPIPSLAFFHIPLPEFKTALEEKWLTMNGYIRENPGCSKYNSGLFIQMKELGDIKAIICGHDHNNDYVHLWQEMLFIYGRFSGCDTVYNDLKPNGARIFEMEEDKETIHTWIRLYDQGIIQDEIYPSFFQK